MYQGYIWYSQVILCLEPKNWNFGSFWAFLSIFKPKFCIFRKFCQFSEGCHRLQFRPFDHPISHARSLELGQFGASRFGRFWVHLEVKKSILVHFWMIFWIYLGPLLGAFGNICIKELLNIYLSTFTFFICAKKRDFNTPPLVVSLCYGECFRYNFRLK